MHLATQEQLTSLYPLLNYLAQGHHPAHSQWRNWQITHITGGANNLLYRATSSIGDFAIKFTIRDNRDRAGREYEALLALHKANLPLAPKPILLERYRYAQPVVVQTWLNGDVMTAPPTSETEWQSILKHYAIIHTVKPDRTDVSLSSAFLNARNIKTGREIVQQQVAYLPKETQPTSLQDLIHRFERTRFSEWSDAPIALCRVDPNYLNFIRRAGLWGSVDWESSGWGDPAFEIADLMTHPAYRDVSSSRWEWVIDTYCNLTDDPTAAKRIRIYYKIMLVWWVARLARYLYEVPQGLDERLVSRPVNWQTEIYAKYDHYLSLAETMW